jgi:hypothetical protein
VIGQPLSKLKSRDALLWSLDVGRMHSRNNILVQEDCAFLSTSGEHWNKPDTRDGVQRVDLIAGSKGWFSKTESDANEISLIGNVLLVGTDQGKAFAIRADNGDIIEEIILGKPIYTKAIKLQTAGGQIAILFSYGGDVIQYDLVKNKFKKLGVIPYAIRANPIVVNKKSLLVGSESGLVLLIDVEEDRIRWEPIFQIPPYRSSGAHSFDLQVKGISSLVIVGDRVILSYVRDTYDRRPPIICFSLGTRQKVWDAGRVQSASKEDEQTFGNSRITPACWKNLLISTFSYNESIHAFSLDTGRWAWRVRLDNSYFQNWSSPIVKGDVAYVARVNGVISAIDLNLKKLISAYSIEVFETAEDVDGLASSGDSYEPWPNASSGLESQGPWPSQHLVAGICATPAIWRENILVGTVSGHLICLRPPNVSRID